MDSVAARKRELRKQIRDRLATLTGPELQEKSRRIAENLFSTSWWEQARWVFAYIAMPAEVETREIIVGAYRSRKQVAIPRMEGHHLAFYRYHGRTQDLLPHQFGVLEPDPGWEVVDPCRLAEESAANGGGCGLLVLAPGLGFDRHRRRLGRGKGYYDRLLSGTRCAGIEHAVVGLAYAEQLVDEIPV
ncbi:MAG: 5-formyltetrahydrofolate cyclo-ligase, partial [Spirochaetales bacterium]|nr:5-formyltetrahydrofolate cyclo-ligase [Spirochaetales bacterium]